MKIINKIVHSYNAPENHFVYWYDEKNKELKHYCEEGWVAFQEESKDDLESIKKDLNIDKGNLALHIENATNQFNTLNLNVANLQTYKQDVVDNDLISPNKNVIDAINDIYIKLRGLEEVYSGDIVLPIVAGQTNPTIVTLDITLEAGTYIFTGLCSDSSSYGVMDEKPSIIITNAKAVIPQTAQQIYEMSSNIKSVKEICSEITVSSIMASSISIYSWSTECINYIRQSGNTTLIPNYSQTGEMVISNFKIYKVNK